MDPERTWNEADDEALITIIQENPTLWDKSRNDFRDSKKKQRIFQQISQHFSGFSAMQLEKRFIALKEKLRREKKREDALTRSGAGARNWKSWYLLPKLEFLRETMNTRPTVSSIPSSLVKSKTSYPGSSLTAAQNIISPTPNTLTPSPAATPSSLEANNVSENLTTEISQTDNERCPPNNSKSANKIREALYEESREAIRKIAESVSQPKSQSVSEPEDMRTNHFKIFDYMAKEAVEMDPIVKTQFIKKVLDVFWEFKLK
ncbi:uncharacterized protein LOC129918654 [Episyrphus balteatus]|uniref:uncharacterized protein LOC129918654 n=1 Tax=Episyrphus balteatus TaxID=286459 RepID=UPI002486ACCF|nr:uncharacterized protein LOC129918654 [Episyrphus balteatus]